MVTNGRNKMNNKPHLVKEQICTILISELYGVEIDNVEANILDIIGVEIGSDDADEDLHKYGKITIEQSDFDNEVLIVGHRLETEKEIDARTTAENFQKIADDVEAAIAAIEYEYYLLLKKKFENDNN